MRNAAACNPSWRHRVDPRRSLAAGAMWLIIGLAGTFAIAAGAWVGRIARDNVLEQHVRRLLLETDQLSTDLGQAVVARLDAIRAAGRMVGGAGIPARANELQEVFAQLEGAYPQFEWNEVASLEGVVVASSSGGARAGAQVAAAPWFSAGAHGPWLGVVEGSASSDMALSRTRDSTALGDMAAPVLDAAGHTLGVIVTRLSWHRAPAHPARLTDESNPRIATEMCVLDRNGLVLIGPDAIRGQPWNGVPLDASPMPEAPGARFERLADGKRVLVSRVSLSAGHEIASSGWQVQLSEPNERVYQRADAVAFKIFGVSVCLGFATALLGALGVRHLTRRLRRLTVSVASVGEHEAAQLEVPEGSDEVAQLGHAFAKILGDLQRERRELKTLSEELERRVAVRTREVQRLAEESRYAAIVRERLKIARDLHDTLAHSMMAILSEIRFLRRLQTRDPSQLPAELARAEDLAHEGLQDARSAIAQMRVNAVREMGLGPALANEFERFINRTGLAGEFSSDVEAGRFGDERAESLLRMAQEVLRNVEQHAIATHVSVKLAAAGGPQLELFIEDNGVGFDPSQAHPGHFGLVGLREQAELIGAQLTIDSAPQAGTRVRVTLRVPPAAFETR